LQAVRIIPCLDIENARVVKGTRFLNLKDAGDPVELARFYNDEGADELVFLDITASFENRDPILNLVNRVSNEIFIPFSVGGGIGSCDMARQILRNGADKIAVNTQAIKRPQLIKELATEFGSQCVVVAIDVKKVHDEFRVYSHGGRIDTGLELTGWIKDCEKLGAGEFLVTSMDKDGTKDGYDLELLNLVNDIVHVPIIASGGAGGSQDFLQAAKSGADGLLAASVFHYKELSIKDVKAELSKNGITTRPV
jgi:cyclase